MMCVEMRQAAPFGGVQKLQNFAIKMEHNPAIWFWVFMAEF